MQSSYREFEKFAHKAKKKRELEKVKPRLRKNRYESADY